MEIGEMLGDSFEYTKEGLVGKWVRWILLVVSTIIFPLIYGYIVRIYRGDTPAPELEDWGGLFVDGIKLLIIYIIYAIPVIIVGIITIGGSVAAMVGGGRAATAAGLGGLLLGGVLMLILGIIISLIAMIGVIRFARKGSMGEAFNISAILETIRAIGWLNYIFALIVLWIVMMVVSFVLSLITVIPVIGWIIYLFAIPALMIYQARYFCLLYDSAGGTV